MVMAMTEKRFEMVIVDVQGNFYYLDRVTDEKISSTLALEGKLNELANENEQLKKENKELRQYLGWQEMELEELEDINKNVIE